MQVIIGDILPYTQATASGGQTVFGTNWTADAASDVKVYLTPLGNPPNDVTQILQFPSQYSVAFIGDQEQVQVTLVTPAGLGDIVTIIRQTPADRENLYTNTNFTPSMLNQDFGILTLVDQQAQLVDQKIGPRYNYAAVIIDVVDTILPILGANQFWAKNSANTAIIPFDISEIIGGGTVTQVDTGLGLTGGPITVTGTISMEPTLPISIQQNITRLGILGQDLDMSNHLIHNLTDPVVAQDAATKAYVDTFGGAFLPLSGGTMTGIISMGNHKITNLTDPSSAQDAVTLNYLQTQLNLYLPLSGGTMTGLINMNSHKITGLTDPTNPQDAATKNYVDLVATGFAVQPAVFAATTGALTATYNNGASGIGATLTNAGAFAVFSIDGVNPATNARVLIKNQASALQNGIYTVTNVGDAVSVNWILTRAVDYDQPSEIQPGDLVVVNAGSTLAGTSFIETASVAAVGTDAINFSQFTFSATAVLLKANNLSDVANTTTSFNNISPLTTKGDLIGRDATNNVRLAVGATNAQILQVNSAAATGLAWSTATYPVTTTINQILFSNATNTITGIASLAGGVLVTNASGVPQMLTNPASTGRILMSGNAAIPTWSTAIYPSTAGTSGNVLTSDGTNWISSASSGSGTVNPGLVNQLAYYAISGSTVSGLTTANSSVLVTSAAGVPSLSTVLPNGLSVTSISIQSILDISSHLNIVLFGAQASAVNSFSMSATPTGTGPILQSTGSDTNIAMFVLGKGTSGINIGGYTDASAGVAGYVGEYISASVLTASAVAVVNATAKTIATISLTAGDWDVQGCIATKPSAGTTTQYVYSTISTTTNTRPTVGAENNTQLTTAAVAANFGWVLNVGPMRINVSTTTNVFLVAEVGFAVSTMAVYGFIGARRRR